MAKEALPSNGHDNPVLILTDYLLQQEQRLNAQEKALTKGEKMQKKGEKTATPWDQDKVFIRNAIFTSLEAGQITSDSVYAVAKNREVKPMMVDVALEAVAMHAQTQRAGLVLEMHVAKDRGQILVELEKTGLSSEVFDKAIMLGRLNIGDNMEKIMWAIKRMRDKEDTTINHRNKIEKGATRKGDSKGKVRHTEQGGRGLRSK